MPCRDFVECVTMYLEGTLGRSDRKRLEAHLRECEPCALYLEQLRHTMQITGKLEPEPVPGHVKDDLARIFTQWKGPL
jgi:anti-sigma factor RsiW